MSLLPQETERPRSAFGKDSRERWPQLRLASGTSGCKVWLADEDGETMSFPYLASCRASVRDEIFV
jgi:hypothetical protein